MSDEERPLNTEKPYYRWYEYEGSLTIESECCMDSFSESEEVVLRDWLLARHPLPKGEAS